MRLTRFSVLAALSVLFTFPLMAQKSPEQLQKEINAAIQEATNQPGMFSVVNDWRFELTAPGTVLSVWNRIKASKSAREIWSDVENLAYEMAFAEVVVHLKQAAQAGKLQFNDWLKFTQEIAREKHIPEHVVKDAWVFIKQNPVPNAYTISGVPDRMAFMTLFTGIIDLMDRGALKNVVGHELGHGLGRHVFQNIMLSTLFMTYGEDLLPKDDSQAQTIRRQLLRTAMRSMTMCRDCELEPASFKVAEDGIMALVAKLRARGPSSDLQELVTGISNDLGYRGEWKGLSATGSARTPGIKEVMEFEERLKDLGRQWESQADFEGLVSSTLDDSRRADMLLAGGKGMTVKGALAQLDRLRRLLADNPKAAQQTRDDKSHPSAGERIEAYEQLVRTRQYRTLTDRFSMAAYYYVRASKLIAKLESDVLDRTEEVGDLNQKAYTIKVLIELTKKLEIVLVREIQSDFDLYFKSIEGAEAASQSKDIPKPSFDRFIFLAEEFDTTRRDDLLDRTRWRQENATKRRVPSLLGAYFEAKLKIIEQKRSEDPKGREKWAEAEKIFDAARDVVRGFSRGDLLSDVPKFRDAAASFCSSAVAGL